MFIFLHFTSLYLTLVIFSYLLLYLCLSLHLSLFLSVDWCVGHVIVAKGIQGGQVGVKMTMKRLSSSQSHHNTLTCRDPSYDSLVLHQDRHLHPLILGDSLTTDHTHCADHAHVQYSNCEVNLASSTFPRRHYGSRHDECTMMVPAQRPLKRDGFHTLQYKRTVALEHHRSDSPGRIRNLVQSVQKLFTKSHSLEGPGQHGLDVSDPALPSSPVKSTPNAAAFLNTTLPPGTHTTKRSKVKEHNRSELKPHTHSLASGYWSSDDVLDKEVYHFQHCQPLGVMTMGRRPHKSQSHYVMQHAYNTLGTGKRPLKTSQSNNDLGRCSTCLTPSLKILALPAPEKAEQSGPLVKKSSWSGTLTVSRAREVYQKGVNMDKALVNTQSCQQGRACQFLQVGHLT